MTFEDIITRFPGPQKPNGDGSVNVCCPAHESKGKNSLHISRGNGKGPLLKCHAGCDTGSVLEAVGLTWRDVLPPREPEAAHKPAPKAAWRDMAVRNIARCAIRDPAGNLIAIHIREDKADHKRIWWEMPDGTPKLIGIKLRELPLYGIEQLATAPAHAPVILCEGEKAADALRVNSILAVGTVTGASGTPGDESLRPLLGHSIYLWPDNDDPGQKHMDRIGAALLRLGHKDVRIIDWTAAPQKGDAADLVSLEGWRDDFDALTDEAEPLEASAEATLATPEAPVPLFTQCLADIEVKPVTWLWKDRLPLGKLAVIAGEPGLGKSRLALSIAATTSQGGYWPGNEGICQKGEVLILNFEDDPADTTVPRLMAEGADLSAIHQLLAVPDEKGRRAFDVSRDTDRLAKYLELHPKMALVIVDPITACLGQTDSHKNAEVRAALHPLAEVAQRFGVCVLAVTHLNKGTGMRAIHRITGSIAFTAAARVVFAVARDEQDPEGKRRLFVPVKNNVGNDHNGRSFGTEIVRVSAEIVAPRIVWGDAVTISADEALSPPDEERGAMEEACEFLTMVLAGGPVAVDKVTKDARGAGIAAVTLKRAKRALKVKTEKNRDAGRLGMVAAVKGIMGPLYHDDDPLR